MKCCLSALQSDLEKTTGAVRSATGVWSDEQKQQPRLSQAGGPQLAFSLAKLPSQEQQESHKPVSLL